MPGYWGEQLQNAAGTFFGSDYLRDYQHASKTFRSNSYANAPKYKFSFHTYFTINTDAYPNATDQNVGILVKDIKLPGFGFNTQVLNQYNRKRIVQTKIRYEPVQITFHDDNNNTINNLWYSYYTYYYKDATKPSVKFNGSRVQGRVLDPNSNTTQSTAADYDIRNIYSDVATGNDDWGYIGETSKPAGPNGGKAPFFKDIRIFGFNQHNFIAYVLINPIITQFSHDTYNYEETGGVMKNTMTIDYETVVYDKGAIDGNAPGEKVTGFGDVANYDRTTSPINKPGANSKIMGQGGLIDAAGGFVEALQDGNIVRAVQIAGTARNTIKNTDLKNTLKQEIQTSLQNTVQQALTDNRALVFQFPVRGATPSTVDTAGTPNPGQSSPTQVGRESYAGRQIPSGTKTTGP
jgi:hypothetical protein